MPETEIAMPVEAPEIVDKKKENAGNKGKNQNRKPRSVDEWRLCTSGFSCSFAPHLRMPTACRTYGRGLRIFRRACVGCGSCARVMRAVLRAGVFKI